MARLTLWPRLGVFWVLRYAACVAKVCCFVIIFLISQDLHVENVLALGLHCSHHENKLATLPMSLVKISVPSTQRYHGKTIIILNFPVEQLSPPWPVLQEGVFFGLQNDTAKTRRGKEALTVTILDLVRLGRNHQLVGDFRCFANHPSLYIYINKYTHQ